MDMFDEAMTIAGMIKMMNLTQKEAARQLGVSQSYVANKVRLLTFSDGARDAIRRAGLSERHARCLLRVKDEDKLYECIKRAHDEGLTVERCEAMVDIAVEAEVPRLLGRAPRNERIDRFLEFLSASLESLASVGISAHKEVGIYKNRRYITIRIDEV
ncbi:MAG: hypothetical protein J6Q69_01575 [Clostridia bacterium]|nr:hypothetical protein [Clostridia bacterium]